MALRAKGYLVPLLPATPFFALVTNVGPQGIELNLTELASSHEVLLQLVHVASRSFDPLSHGFLFHAFDPVNEAELLRSLPSRTPQSSVVSAGTDKTAFPWFPSRFFYTFYTGSAARPCLSDRFCAD
jgi:hypothetical protein